MAMLLGGFLILSGTLHGLLTDNDFFTMFDSSALFTQDRSAYGLVPGQDDSVGLNLNHPAIVLIVVPLTVLPRAAAFAVFALLSGAALACTVTLLMRELDIQGLNRWVFATAVILFPGVAYCLAIGQLGIFLALAVTAVWICIRRRQWVLAGALIGVLIALKPFFLPLLGVLLIRRQAKGVLAALGGAAGISAATLPFVGIGTFEAWLRALTEVHWFDHPLNVSLAGLLHRLTEGTFAPAEVTAITVAVVLTASLVVAFVAAPSWTARRDRDFALLLCAALLGSPLGWLYYLPVLAPALAVVVAGWPHFTPRARFSLLVGAALLWVPYGVPPLLADTPAGALIAGTHTYAMVGLILVFAGIVPLTAGNSKVADLAGLHMARFSADSPG